MNKQANINISEKRSAVEKNRVMGSDKKKCRKWQFLNEIVEEMSLVVSFAQRPEGSK